MCIFPIVVNVATGLATTEPELEDVMRALRATKLDILWNVGLPRTMPFFFASLKVAVTLAFVGTVISETVASNRGIGNVMMIASSNFDVPLVFAGLIINKQGRGIQQTFTVRRISYGEGVERVFPTHSPFIQKIEVERAGDVHRAKLYYLRDRVGKTATKVKEA